MALMLPTRRHRKVSRAFAVARNRGVMDTAKFAVLLGSKCTRVASYLNSSELCVSGAHPKPFSHKNMDEEKKKERARERS